MPDLLTFLLVLLFPLSGPAMARNVDFISADPSGFGGGLNMYAFADGNPITEMDPFGLGAVGDENLRGGTWLAQVVEGLGFDVDLGGDQVTPPTITVEQVARGILGLATGGLYEPALGLVAGQDIDGNPVDRGGAAEQLMQVATVDANLFLALSTEGFSAEAEGATGGLLSADPTGGSTIEGTATQLEFGFARGASIQTPGVTTAGETFVRVGAVPENLNFGLESLSGARPRTFAFPEATFNSIGQNPAALQNFGDLPGAAPQYFRVLRPPAGTPIQRGIVPGGQNGGVGGVGEVFFPRGF